MAIIKVDGIEDIKYLDKMVNKGSFGEIYPFSDDTYFKKLNRSQMSLCLLDNQIRLEILTDLMNLKGTNLNYISREVKLKDLLEAYLELTKDIKLLAENNINIFDIHAGNLLYNGSLYMLDFDLSKVDTVNSADKMYKRAAYQVFQQILRVIVWLDKSQDLYTILNHYHIRDFNLGALQCGIIDITSSVEEFKESLFSLGLDDRCTLKDVDIVLRRKKNGY